LLSSLIGRVKRSLLDLAVRAGYDVEKASGSFPPYRLLKRLNLDHDPLAAARIILDQRVTCVFDVGAHVGQTALRLAAAFPHGAIYSFEPDPESFSALRGVAGTVRDMEAVNAAVGDTDGKAVFFVNRFDQTSSLLETAPGASQYLLDKSGLDRRAEIEVPVLTLDRFCAARGITRIDVLKLDAQGYELRILDGARDLLNRQAIPIIYLEVCFVRIYEGQPLFPEIYQYLFERGYRLVWLYDSSFRTHFYALGANALFVHESIGTRVDPAQRGSHAMAATV
jgi:FkbM family methyltransferase